MSRAGMARMVLYWVVRTRTETSPTDTPWDFLEVVDTIG